MATSHFHRRCINPNYQAKNSNLYIHIMNNFVCSLSAFLFQDAWECIGHEDMRCVRHTIIRPHVERKHFFSYVKLEKNTRSPSEHANILVAHSNAARQPPSDRMVCVRACYQYLQQKIIGKNASDIRIICSSNIDDPNLMNATGDRCLCISEDIERK